MTVALERPKRQRGEVVPLDDRARELASRPEYIELARRTAIRLGERSGVDHLESESVGYLMLCEVARLSTSETVNNFEALLIHRIKFGIKRVRESQTPGGFRNRFSGPCPKVLSIDAATDEGHTLAQAIADPNETGPTDDEFEASRLDSWLAPIAGNSTTQDTLRMIFESNSSDPFGDACDQAGKPRQAVYNAYYSGIKMLKRHHGVETTPSRPGRRNASGYPGVRFDYRAGKYLARRMIKGVRKDIGYFPTAVEAYRAYLVAGGDPIPADIEQIIHESHTPIVEEQPMPAAPVSVATRPPLYPSGEAELVGQVPVETRVIVQPPHPPANVQAIIDETQAMASIARTLAALEPAAMGRVLSWAGSAFGPLAGI